MDYYALKKIIRRDINKNCKCFYTNKINWLPGAFGYSYILNKEPFCTPNETPVKRRIEEFLWEYIVWGVWGPLQCCCLTFRWWSHYINETSWQWCQLTYQSHIFILLNLILLVWLIVRQPKSFFLHRRIVNCNV